MIKWNDKIQDMHMEGKTPFGRVFIRFNNEGKTTAMYTCFGSTKKYLPDKEWMNNLGGAQLQLEILTAETKRLRKWGELLRSKGD